MPPTAALRTIPPNALSDGTCLRNSQARSAVATTWLFITTASIPLSR